MRAFIGGFATNSTLWLRENPIGCLPRNVHAMQFVDMPEIAQTMPSTSCADPLGCPPSGADLLFLRHWGRWQVLIYLFRDERTDNRALTMDVTGRNISRVTSSTVWLFVEAIDTHKLPPQWDTAYLRYAVRQARMIGFYCFEPGRVTQTC